MVARTRPVLQIGRNPFPAGGGGETRGSAIMNVAGKGGALKAVGANAICTLRAARTDWPRMADFRYDAGMKRVTQAAGPP